MEDKKKEKKSEEPGDGEKPITREQETKMKKNEKNEEESKNTITVTELEPEVSQSPKIFAPDWHRFRINIREYRHKKDKKSNHVVYVIIIREYYDAATYIEWPVERRYSEFRKFHHKLKAKFPRVAI